MSDSGDRDDAQRLKESVENLGGQVKKLAHAGVRWVYWMSGASRHDPMLRRAVEEGYVEGTKRGYRGWWDKGTSTKKRPGEDLPS